MAEEKDELLAQIRKLKNQLEEERQKHSKVDSAFTDGERMENGTDLHFIEMQSKLTFLHNSLQLLFLCLFVFIVILIGFCFLFRRCQQTD